jgi:hypothetical protein
MGKYQVVSFFAVVKFFSKTARAIFSKHAYFEIFRHPNELRAHALGWRWMEQ